MFKKLASALLNFVGIILLWIVTLMPFLFVIGVIWFFCSFAGSFWRIHSTDIEDIKDEWGLKLIIEQDDFHPVDLAISEDGTVYATDFYNKCIWSWNEQTGIKRFVSNLPNLRDIALSSEGNIWVSEKDKPIIHIIAQKGEIIKKLNLADSVKEITCLSYDKFSGAMLILDRKLADVSTVSIDGKITTLINDPHKLLHHGGQSRKWIWNAYSLASGGAGEIYIFDFDGCIQTVRPDGKRFKQGTLTMEGNSLTRLEFAPGVGLVISAAGSGNKSVFLMTVPDMKFKNIFKSNIFDTFKCPCGLAISTRGVIYVCSPSKGIIATLTKKLDK